MMTARRQKIKEVLRGVEAAEQLCSIDLLEEISDVELREAHSRLRYLIAALDIALEQRFGASSAQ